MNDYYIKKYWEEEDILFYLHFHNKLAVRQIEVLSGEAVCLTIENLFRESICYVIKSWMICLLRNLTIFRKKSLTKCGHYHLFKILVHKKIHSESCKNERRSKLYNDFC